MERMLNKVNSEGSLHANLNHQPWLKLKSPVNFQVLRSPILKKSESEDFFSKTAQWMERRQKQNRLTMKTQVVVNYHIQSQKYRGPGRQLNELKLEDFEIGQFLGRGRSCTAHVARHIQTGFFCCIKTMKKATILSNLEAFSKSLKIQMYVSHPNVAQTYGMIVEKDKVYILMELCVDGDLYQNLKELRKKEESKKSALKGLIRGLKYLHDTSIQHRDIKLQNILICFGMMKIADFDLAVFMPNNRNNKKRTTICGSPLYFSPEMIKKKSYDKKSDIWCLGLVAYQILYGYHPFSNFREGIGNIADQETSFSNQISYQAKDLLEKLLSKNPDLRLSLLQVIRHPYFEDLK